MRVAHVEARESSLAVLLHDRLTSQPVVDDGAGADARTSDRLGPEAHRSPYLGFARTSCSLTVRHASGVRAPPPGEGELLDFGRRQVDVQADVRQTAFDISIRYDGSLLSSRSLPLYPTSGCDDVRPRNPRPARRERPPRLRAAQAPRRPARRAPGRVVRFALSGAGPPRAGRPREGRHQPARALGPRRADERLARR